jgi:hypothetical protein
MAGGAAIEFGLFRAASDLRQAASPQHQALTQYQRSLHSDGYSWSSRGINFQKYSAKQIAVTY